ncbi:MAG: chloride channel protein [Gammaproteobacteria bacterium]|nr:chloride channel protein [Gammaproteobacteria bacterium]
MLAVKNIVIELISAVLCGVAIGLAMAITANAFVEAAVYANEYRNSLPWLEVNFGSSTYSLSSIFSLLLAALLITWLRKWLHISHWQGPADSIYAAHSEDPTIETSKGLGSTLAAFIVISGGGSVGQYGPLVHFGSTIGLFIKKYFRVQMTPDIFIGCGVAAAISAGFNAPLAGVIFAHEAILRHFSLRAIAPIFIASISASAFDEYFFGATQNLFDLSQSIPPLNDILPMFIALGPIFAIVAVIFMYSLRAASIFAERADRYRPLLPFIAALTCGMVGVIFPEILGLGIEPINDLIAGNFSYSKAGFLLIAKISMTALCIGFGLFGGVFSPALFIGVATGSLAAAALSLFGYVGAEQIIIISGMAAVGASVIGAPLSSVLIVLELTGSYDYAVAAMVAVIISTLVTYRIFGLSFFDRQLLDRGIDMRLGRESIALSQRPVTACFASDYVRLDSKTSGDQAFELMKKAGMMESYIINAAGEYEGKVDIFGAISASTNSVLDFIVNEPTTLSEDDSLQTAMTKTVDFVGESIPILSADKKYLKAVVSEGSIFQAVIDVQHAVSKIGRA